MPENSDFFAPGRACTSTCHEPSAARDTKEGKVSGASAASIEITDVFLFLTKNYGNFAVEPE
jgi:hypothetical protein